MASTKIRPEQIDITALLEYIYPIGSFYANYSDNTNPGTLLGIGTWVAAAVGRSIVGLDAGQTEFDTAGETGGSKTHTLTSSESGLVAHGHNIVISSTAVRWGNETNDGRTTGSSYDLNPDNGTGTQATAANNTAANASSEHNNLQPYEVWYIWRRTA